MNYFSSPPRLSVRHGGVVSMLALLALSGCASLSDDGGLAAVADMTQQRTGYTVASWRTSAQQSEARTTQVAQLLAQALSADSAVQLALLQNRGLQAQLAQLGIAEADWVRAARLPNPSFSFARMSGPDGVEIERGVSFNLLGLLTWPLQQRLESERLAQTQLHAAAEAVALAAEVRRSYFEAVAAEQLLRGQAQLQEAADIAGELAQRMVAAGHFSPLEQMRVQAEQAEAKAQWQRAQHQALASREKLSRLLGLSAAQRDFRLPEQLPALPAEPMAAQALEQTALRQRLDVQIAQQNASATARSLGLSQATRFINVLHLGHKNQSASGEPRHNGYEVELELPLFDFGQARLARAEAVYMQALHQAAQVAIQAQSEVREAYSGYHTAYRLAQHYRDHALPLRQRMAEQALLRYNGMLASVFELLADARSQIQTANAAIEAQRDYWVAETQLQASLSGRSPGAIALPVSGVSSNNNRPAAH